MASRNSGMPGPGGYWFRPLRIAAAAASSISCGPSVSGKPWPRLTAPVRTASADISAKIVVPNGRIRSTRVTPPLCRPAGFPGDQEICGSAIGVSRRKPLDHRRGRGGEPGSNNLPAQKPDFRADNVSEVWATLAAMCGIVGYVGARPALGIVLDGLRRLEYRGYDSAGVAVVTAGRC